MWKADLQALRNLVRTPAGRQALAGLLIVLFCTVLGSVVVSGNTLLSEDVVQAVSEDGTGALARAFYALTLLLPVLGLFALGVAQLDTELYGAPKTPILLTAPVSSFALVARAFLRSVAGWLPLCLAIGLPPVLGLAERSALSATPALLYPVAVLLLIAPLVALQLLLKVVLVRWFSGPRIRLVLLSLHVVGCVAIAVLLIAGIISGENLSQGVRTALEQGVPLPWLLKAPASLLSATAGFGSPPGLLAANLLLLLLPLPFLACAAVLYRRSYEARITAGTGTRRSVASRGGGWPLTPMRSFLAKGLAENIRVRTNLVATFVIALLMVGLLARGVSAEAAAGQELVPAAMRHAMSILFDWHMLSLLLACLCFATVVGDEQKQIVLLSSAPFPRSALLRSKMLTLAWPFVLCLVIAVMLGPPLAGISLGSAVILAASGVPILLFLLGVLLAVGTWPAVIRVHDDLPLSHSLHAIVPVLVISVLGFASLIGVLRAKGLVTSAIYDRGLLAGASELQAGLIVLAIAWMIGIAVFAIGYRIGLGNLERLLGPQRN